MIRPLFVLSMFLLGVVPFGLAQKATQLELGTIAFEQENWKSAIEYLNPWIQEHPSDSEGYWIRGQAWQRLGQYDQAMIDFSNFLTLEPENSEAYFERGRVRYLLKQYNEALDDFEKFLLLPPGETNRVLFRIAPGDTGVSSMTTAQSFTDDLAYYHMGLCAIELKNYELALSYLDLAVDTNPGEADYYSERGKALARLGDNMAAIESFELALELDPEHQPAKQGLAAVKTGGDELLLQELNDLIELGNGNAQTFKQRGFYHLSHSNSTQAILDFSQSIGKEPNDPETYFYRAWAFSRQKEWEKAEEDYSQAIFLEPQNPEYYLARGQSRFQKGEFEAALADFILTVTIDPEHASGYYHKGISFQRMGKKEEACAEFAKAMELGMEAAENAWKKICQVD